MKALKISLITGLLLCLSLSAKGQMTGNTLQNPEQLGTKSGSFTYNSTRIPMMAYTDTYGVTGPDLFMKITLTVPMEIEVIHTNLNIHDSYLHILNSAGNEIAYNDDYNGLMAYINTELSAGIYYIVTEAKGCTGYIGVTIKGQPIVYSGDYGYSLPPSITSGRSESVGSMGGSFNVTEMGSANYAIPIKVPVAQGGVQPQLSIVYDSQSESGLCGYGATIGGISTISRGTKDIYHDGVVKGVNYLADDALYYDGVRLILTSGTPGQDGTIYYPESDPFTKIIAHGICTSTSNNTWFEVQKSNGEIIWLGCNHTSRQSYNDNNGNQKIRAWYIDRIIQPTGNYMQYYYDNIDNCIYPYLIAYGVNTNTLSSGLVNQVLLAYETSNGIPVYFDDQHGTLNKRLKTITCTSNDHVYRTYTLDYNNTSDGTDYKFSRLIRVTESNGNNETLPSTVFNWSYLPSLSYQNSSLTVSNPSTPNNISLPFGDQFYVSGDLNNDGIDDIAGLTAGVTVNGQVKSYLYIYWAQKSSNSVTYPNGTLFEMPNLFNSDWFYGGEREDFHSFFNGSAIADWDGDGFNEVVLPYYYTTSSQKYIKFHLQGCGSTGQSSWNQSMSCPLNTNGGIVYSIADLDNDGRDDIAVVEKSANGGSYSCHLLSYDPTSSSYTKIHNFQLSLSSAPKQLYLSDLNGNGVKDLLVICQNNYTVYWNQGGSSIISTMFSESYKKSGSNLKYCNMTTSGDFNGDGLLDILTNNTGSSNWNIYFNNGDGTFVSLLACSLGLYDQNFTDRDDNKFHCRVFDFDGDGKDDVVITKAVYDKKQDKIFGIPIGEPWGEFNTTYTYWMHSVDNGLVEYCHASSKKESDAYSKNYIIGDYNGDGLKELISYGYNCLNEQNANSNGAWRLFKHSSYSVQSGKVTSITGDYGQTINITYSTLADANVYTRGAVGTYPVHNYTIPLNVVKTTIKDNGAAGSQTTNHSYSGFKFHLNGRGALGFTSTQANNTTFGTTVISEVTGWNNTYYVPSSTKVATTIGGYTSQVQNTMSFVNKGGKNFFAYPSQTVETDFDGMIVSTTRSYNTTYGYPTNETVTYGANMYKSISYDDYVLAGNAYHPQTVTTIQRHADDTAPFSSTVKYTYDLGSGSITKMIENYGKTKPLTTQYTFDLWGNLTSKIVSGSGVSNLTTYYKYDSTHRFPIRVYTSPSSSVRKFSYDIWGNVLTEQDSINSTISTISNVTTHTYDAWGNLVRTQKPGSGEIKYVRGWGHNTRKCFYVLEQGISRPWVKTWYDSQGREVLVESVGPQNVPISTTTSYDIKGLKDEVRQTNGNLTLSHSYDYDARGRLIIETHPGNNSITYSYGSNGRTKTINDNGRSTTYTYDVVGNLITVQSPLSSTLTHTYSSNGKVKQTVANGVTWMMTYDDCGNQISINDPDAGTSQFTYDALGREIWRRDGRGNTYSTYYDAFGRVTYDGTTTYTYGTSGTGQSRLVSESNNWWIKNYSYDVYGRVTQETMVKYAVSTRSMSYEYDANGLLAKKYYPYNKTAVYSYDSYGNRTNINFNNGMIIWSLTGDNGKTKTSSVRIGNSTPHIRTTQLDDYGYLQSRTLTRGNTTEQNDNYVFNPRTGNLTSRTLTGHAIETFSYDNLDRLTGEHGSEINVDMYYETNGNFNEKTDVGEYHYPSGNAHAHAVDYIDVNPYADVPDFNQYIEYDYRDKPDYIAYELDGNDYWYDMEYGPNHQRVMSHLENDGALVREKFYWDEYEEYHMNGFTICTYWVEAPDGLAGLIVNYNNEDSYAYVAMTDHLGSLTRLLEYDGEPVFEATYDAWGKRTVAPNSLPIDRGFTGHEHIDELGLINMNGRMYDPMQGVFLSPDRYIQNPSNPQNYNRYSYCLNNSLKYTDHTGESFTIFTAVWDFVCTALFKGGLDITSPGAMRDAWKDYDPTAPWSMTNKAFKIETGLFKTDPNKDFWGRTKELVSRFTVQLPQTLLGYTVSEVHNIMGDVKSVDYYGGATVVESYSKDWGAFTLGNYINGCRYYEEGNVKHGIKADPKNSLFQHEYGHYIQSQDHGPYYLLIDGFPSLLSALMNPRSHEVFYTELDANRRAFQYFKENEKDFCYEKENGKWGSHYWHWTENPMDKEHNNYYLRNSYNLY